MGADRWDGRMYTEGKGPAGRGEIGQIGQIGRIGGIDRSDGPDGGQPEAEASGKPEVAVSAVQRPAQENSSAASSSDRPGGYGRPSSSVQGDDATSVAISRSRAAEQIQVFLTREADNPKHPNRCVSAKSCD